eukprot:7333068-Alexandrium_andersonii.AAC.1
MDCRRLGAVARWRNGTWYSSQPTPASAGMQFASADGSWQTTRAWGWAASADGALGQSPDGGPPSGAGVQQPAAPTGGWSAWAG